MEALKYSVACTAHKKSSLVKVHDCKICPYVTTSFFLMRNHLQRHQSPLVSFTCDNPLDSYHCKDCNFQTELTLLFKQHIKDRHGIKQKNDDNLIVQHNNQKYVCGKCGFETHFLLTWLRHMRECQQCACKTKEHPNLKQHIQRHRGDEKDITYKCEKCEDKNKYRTSLDRDIRMRHVDKWHQCTVCAYKTIYKANLKKHINLRHVDDLDAKWYECTHCSYRTKHKTYLKRHVNVLHLGEKDAKWYECQHCPYKTKCCSNLTRHVRSKHFNEKSITWYQCNKCSFKTKRERILQKHVDASRSIEFDMNWYDCEPVSYTPLRAHETP